MQAALHQNACAAQGDGLINLLADFVERADVSFSVAGTTIESAEGTDDVADVRVVDVAINDIGDDAVWMTTLANLVGGEADADEVIGCEQCGAIVCRQAFARQSAIKNRLNVGRSE